jgi:hypothetical protein
MFTACPKRPLSTGVPEADLMLFFGQFSAGWDRDKGAKNMAANNNGRKTWRDRAGRLI